MPPPRTVVVQLLPATLFMDLFDIMDLKVDGSTEAEARQRRSAPEPSKSSPSMEALAAEIARKRKTHATNRPETGGKKYFKRGDMEAKRKAAYMAKHRPAGRAAAVKAPMGAPSAASMAAADDAAEAAEAEAAAATGSDEEEEDAEAAVAAHMVPAEVKRRLRALGEVVSYFGEPDERREARLRKIQTTLGDEGTEGRLNIVGELLRQQRKGIMGLEGAAGSLLTEEEKAAKIAEEAKKEMPAPILNRKMTSEQSVANFIQRLVNEYGEAMEARPTELKKTAQGKQDMAYYGEASINVKPLLSLLQKRQLEPDIVAHLELIMQAMLTRDYVKAMEQYVVMTIGNAPWPMGVTSVGIHERAGREKIFEQKTAHILNDEQKRKYIHAFKRLMMFCQAYYPTDPSKTYDPGAVKNTTVFSQERIQSGLSAEHGNTITAYDPKGE